jgi:hypothetical protein
MRFEPQHCKNKNVLGTRRVVHKLVIPTTQEAKSAEWQFEAVKDKGAVCDQKTSKFFVSLGKNP